MRSRLAARSTRLVLAAAAVTALAATTACEPEESSDTGSSAAPSSASSGGGGSETPADDSPSTGAGTTGGSSSGGSDDEGDSGSGDKSGYGQSCGTNDLDFTVAWKSDPDVDGYYLVTAKAKSGITCYLDVNTPSVGFGSGADGVASPVGQGGEDPIKLSGSAVAYTGIDAKTTDGDAGKQFENVIIAVTDDDPEPAELELPDTATVDKPVVTNWSTKRNEVVPRIV
ncbi:DUF4232 domain-containing protein [Streptomyces sp. NPDC057620]|uniref:DUF4232 domain-containing protein n=1 Tax=Streptomyces liliiviolaceus TaxID=2823109 RepID=A0A940Y1V8_9ACTN|nr:DUF4232 domain-containing protein [Streptomyces liliiviolaceus]MBQ0850830.1 DUF4232 domain-containing protein [Streptomyces liliiviolaceus]